MKPEFVVLVVHRLLHGCVFEPW